VNRAIPAIAALLVATGSAAPSEPAHTCYVRTEAFPPPAAASGVEGAAQSFVGVRRKTDQLFELDIAVTGDNDTTCTLTGVAKLRGEPGREVLGMVVRPDPARKTGRTGTLCQVFVQLTSAALVLRTTPSSCQAQSLCEGRIELDGQRFEHSTKLPSGIKGPCFERRAP
jgi:hypothetical protein